MRRPDPRSLSTRLGGALACLTLALGLASGAAAPAHAGGTVVTPGDFTGYGFDQCLAPTQKAMNTWLAHSPFLAVGIYISGDSRACRSQPNLTPDWIRTQLTKGWRLLPITLGPQASCSTRFPRYGDDETIKPRPGKDGTYNPARRQGRAEADKAVAAADALGIAAGSTLWYDLEGFDLSITRCRESALAFLSAWTDRLHALDHVSGVYSSAGSGIRMLDNARVNRPGKFALPDQIWVARWSGVPGQINDSQNTYLRADGWTPHARVHQYKGGHNETWGGVTINIDSNYLDLGRGSVAAPEAHCKGTPVDLDNYQPIRPGSTATERIRALQCFLKEHGVYAGKLTGEYAEPTIAAVHAWQKQRGLTVADNWTRQAWMTLLAAGPRRIVKLGSAGTEVRRVQRTLDAAGRRTRLPITGVFDGATDKALRAYQERVGLKVSGVANPDTWTALRAGLR